jgi:hypothetical protein
MLKRNSFARLCPLVVVLLQASRAAAQPASPDIATYRRDSLDRVRDSVSIDSLSRLVPTDSLRALYRVFPTTDDPAGVLAVIQCTGYRLWWRYGEGANVAEDRVRAGEWTRSLQPSIARQLDAVRASRRIPLPTRIRCGVADDAPTVPVNLKYRSLIPVPPELAYKGPRSLVRDRFHMRGSFFEGQIVGRQTVDLEGTAVLRWHGDRLLALVFDDYTRRPGEIISITLRHAGAEHLRPGTYPIFESNAATPVGVSNFMTVYNQAWPLIPAISSFDRVWGTLVLDRADSTGAEGRVALWQERHASHPFRWRFPEDSLRDTVRTSLRFRAVIDLEDEWARRYYRIPAYAHPTVDGTAVMPANAARPTYRDERVRCEDLPVYRAESVLTPLPKGSAVATATAALEIQVDLLGRVHAPHSIVVLGITDTSVVRHFRNQPGLRFEPARPGGQNLFNNFRCTLTLRREE